MQSPTHVYLPPVTLQKFVSEKKCGKDKKKKKVESGKLSGNEIKNAEKYNS